VKVDFDREKVSWDKLDHVSFNQLNGVDGNQFKPQHLIESIEDEEDKYFLKEFEINPANEDK